jgi:kinetochore protein Mis13/DSN1
MTKFADLIFSLREERDQWKTLAKPPPSLPPLFPDESKELEPSQIDASLLDPEQAAILSELASSSAQDLRKQASERLRTLQSELEFKVDQFADGVHKLEQYQETVGRVADKILAMSAVRLEERDRREKEEIGTRDLPMQEVLRSLSRILPESGSGGKR